MPERKPVRRAPESLRVSFFQAIHLRNRFTQSDPNSAEETIRFAYDAVAGEVRLRSRFNGHAQAVQPESARGCKDVENPCVQKVERMTG